MTRDAWAMLVVLAGCELLDTTGTGGTSETVTMPTVTTGGSWTDSVARGIPCGMLLDCFYSCGDDGACQNECYGASSPRAQKLVDEVEACWDEHACGDDASCAEAYCADELQACREQPLPQGGDICYAEGVYEVCRSGSCTRYDAMNGSWGFDEAAASVWGVYYCSLTMDESMLLASLSADYVGIVEPCEVTSCEPH
ncbi:MAG: hypothetical protein H6738_09080 [Alphaproteobacteria bacterium]|nr:hypothetical protein [Alphaproteobacteria bacterium]MCB9696915.1 hypothetical protein [Alphaproteobacteria bacterium]